MNSNEGRQSQLLQQRQHLRPQRRCQQLRTRRPSHLQRPLEGDTLSLVGQIQQKSKLQQQLMIDVAENIGVQNDLDKTIFLACIWTMQPQLDDEYFNAVEYLKQQ